MKGLEIKECDYGRGVFATRAFQKGEVIERSPALYIESNLQKMSDILPKYVFDSDGIMGIDWIGLGYTSLYNHSFEPNTVFELEEGIGEGWIVMKAEQPIIPGDQLFIDYGYDPVEFFEE